MSEFVSALINQLPVITGGFVAALAGVVGIICNHRLQASAEKSKEKRAQLEMLVAACYQIDEWCTQQEDYCDGLVPQPSKLMPLSKIRSTVFLYFPECKELVLLLSISVREYYTLLLGHASKKNKTQSDNNAHMKKATEQYAKLMTLQENLVEAACTLMEKELG